jgi:hypothetical protein
MIDTSMASISRRDLLSVALALITATNARQAGGASPALQEAGHSEPILELWQKWFAAHKRCGELCLRQQRLETKLFEIERNLHEGEQDKASDVADLEIAYSRALKAELNAADEEEVLVKALWGTPAQSVPGIIAKLHSVVEYGDIGDFLDETPWPELRSILHDLVRINEAGLKI